MKNVLRPLPVHEFVSLSSACGLDVDADVLEQLERRKLLSPLQDGHYHRLHLYLLAVYFEAIRVLRHPWGVVASERSMSDVKRVATDVDAVVSALSQGEGAVGIDGVVGDIERFMGNIDPFGPLSDVIDIVRDDVREQLRGVGRLYSELHFTATALAAVTQAPGRDAASDAPDTREVPEATIGNTAEMSAAEPDAPADSGPQPELGEPGEASEPELSEPSEASEPELSEPSEAAEPELSEPSEASEPELSEPSEASEPELSEPSEASGPSDADDQTRDGAGQPARPTVATEPGAETVERPSLQARVQHADRRDGASGMGAPSADETLDAFPIHKDKVDEAPQETPSSEPLVEAEAEDLLEPDADDTSEDNEASDSSEDFDEADTALSRTEGLDEGSDVAPASEERPKDNPFARDDNQSSGRTQALLERLQEIKSQKEPEEPSEGESDDVNIEQKVNELNQMREELIRAQDWAGLVDLYEERLDLFEEPADLQQVYLTLATLYELKLNDSTKALDSFHHAFEIDVAQGRWKALDSLRKIGAKASNAEQYLEWLDQHTASASDDEMRDTMQRDVSRTLKATGHPQRAFLTYAAYLSESPGDRLDAGTLDFLDELSLDVGDEDLASFYEGVLEATEEDDAQALIGLRAAMFYQGSNQTDDAARCFQIAFDADPSSDLAYTSLSRLYEKDERWSELRSLIAQKMKSAESDDEVRRLRKELTKVVAAETSTDDAIEQFAQTLHQDPNDDSALGRLVKAYEAQGRFTDAYAHLTRHLEKGLDPQQEVRARKALATIALDHLEAPEEAGIHLHRALEIGGRDVEILEGLANVRLMAEEWNEAVAAVEQLTGGDLALADDKRRRWLNAGIEAARQADRPDDVRRFQDRLDVS